MQRVNAVERARDAGVLYEGGYAEVFRTVFVYSPLIRLYANATN